MTSGNEKKLVRLRRISWNGTVCPDGVDCPTQWQTTWGTQITQGRPVSDPEVLRMLNLPAHETAVETPNALWEVAA